MVVDGSSYEGGDGVYFNHSCDPNAEYSQDWKTWEYRGSSGARTDLIILPIVALRYDGNHTGNVTARNISPGEEITISYSDDYQKKAYHRVPLIESITTGFPLTECACGARYCVGEIARDARRGLFRAATARFLEVDQGNRITIDRHQVTLANRERKASAARASPAQTAEKIKELQEVYEASSVMDYAHQPRT